MKVNFDEKGLVPAIVQDARDGMVLMLGYMDEEALKITLEEGYVCFYSRSSGKLWRKGASSGHRLRLVELRINEYDNALLMRAEQIGPGCCHLGYRSCFHRKWNGEEFEVVEKRVFDPEEVYGVET